MAQGEFTKEECDHAKDVLDDLLNAIPKKKKVEYIGHMNDLFLFIEAAKRVAPTVAGKKAARTADPGE